jgi:formyltetrahydrofolate deformylase
LKKKKQKNFHSFSGVSMSRPDPRFVLTLSCVDKIGIVHAVSGFLVSHVVTIIDSAQFLERETDRFFMRVSFAPVGASVELEQLRAGFAIIAGTYAMVWRLDDLAIRPRVLLMVSKFGHCLNDLLYRHRIGALAMDIPAIVSNHTDFRTLAEQNNIPFVHLPVTKDTKATQEQALLNLIDREGVDLVVLARYMQVLSDDLCRSLEGRAINIHHSFLPSFKGARPYHQAHARGVKLVGATAHYVTAVLDEGPIIEQEVGRVDHAMTPDDLVAMGRDIESTVLARAVRLHLERRVLLNGNRTVVFR